MNIYELQERPPTAIRTPTDDLGSICSGNASFSFGCRGEADKKLCSTGIAEREPSHYCDKCIE